MPSRAQAGFLSQLWRGGDEEMAGKKDDDLDLPRHRQPDPRPKSFWHAPRRSVVLRFAIQALVAMVLVYTLYGAIESALDPFPALSRHRNPPPHVLEEDLPKTEEQVIPAKPNLQRISGGKDEDDVEPVKPFNGPLSFPRLKSSLRSVSFSRIGPLSRPVLFAAGSLQSAAALLPMACQMAAEGQNVVHFALVSRSDIAMEELLKVNGIDETCKIQLLDARPTFPTISSETRMALAAARAIHFINAYTSPHAIIVDSSRVEEDHFLSGVRDQARSIQAPLIELPPKAGSRFSWLTKLDSLALNAWNDVQLDILIHAPYGGSASLTRLLKSLSRADLSAINPPHMTVELPPTVSKSLAKYLAGYRWPYPQPRSASHPQMLSLRHRIPRNRVDEEEASVRFLESFWPSRPSHCYVLVMSPHAEVTPQLFDYIKYSILRYRHSAMALEQASHGKVLGISLTTPETHPDGATKFDPPKTKDGETSFLWQAPSSDAIVIPGDKWVEIHGYASKYLEKREAVGRSSLPRKEVGNNQPAWVEYVLQLSRLRGYMTLYPSAQTASALVGVHADLNDGPEEYKKEAKETQAMETFDPTHRMDMLAGLPHEELPSLLDIPWLSWDGKETDEDTLEDDAAAYKNVFRRQVGQCNEGKDRAAEADASDIFCTLRT